MSEVRGLGYIGVGADDLRAWRAFATEVLGMQVGTSPIGDDDPTLYLRMDGRSFRLAIEQGSSEPSLRYLGFEVGTTRELSALAHRLRANGFTVTEESAEICAHRRVARMISMIDPCGIRVEFAVGHEEATAPFVSPTGARFVTGGLGIGHAFVVVPDIERFLDFYIDQLGFRLSDTIELAPGVTGWFLHCNPRHHSLAAVAVAGVHADLQHLMLQVSSIDSVGRAFDKVKADGIPVEAALGKHTNDHMISFSCMTPSGFAVEYGIEGRLVDDETWVVGHYTAASYWGHQREPGLV